MRTCAKCEVSKDETEFNKRNASPDGLAASCKSCARDYRQSSDRRARVAKLRATPEGKAKQREWTIRCVFGLETHEYEALLTSQGGRCANTGCRVDTPGGKGTWHIDHDHSCCPGTKSCGKCIRGLLCSRCNAGLGNFGDDTARLYGAIDYIESFQKRKAA